MVKTNKTWKTPFKVPQSGMSDAACLKVKKALGDKKNRRPLTPFIDFSKTNFADEIILKVDSAKIKNLDNGRIKAEGQSDDSSGMQKCFGSTMERPKTPDLKTMTSTKLFDGDKNSPIQKLIPKLQCQAANENHATQEKAQDFPLRDCSYTGGSETVRELTIDSVHPASTSEQKKIDQESDKNLNSTSGLCSCKTVNVSPPVQILKEYVEKLKQAAQELSELNALVHQAKAEIGRIGGNNLISLV